MIKLLNPELLHESSSGLAICIRVQLNRERGKTVWFPYSRISIETDIDGNRKPHSDVYVDPWILQQKEEEIGNHILVEEN